MAELLPVFMSDAPRAHVVFVHGLGGDGTTYWGKPADSDNYWLKWLGDDLKTVNVWSLQYDAAPLAFLGMAMPLVNRAGNILNLLQSIRQPELPLYFVVHSLGGLVIKKALQQATIQNANKWKQVAERIKGICFLGTPHVGSRMAGFVKYLPWALGVNIVVEELVYNDPNLIELSDWYSNNALDLGIETVALYESQPMSLIEGVPHKGIQKFFKPLKPIKKIIVDNVVGNPHIQGVIPISVDHDHNSMKVPQGRSDQVYTTVLQFLADCLSSQHPPPSNRPTLPLKSTKYFTGHAKELTALEEQLKLGNTALTQPAALKGLGGVGKTHLALKFCEEHDADYPTGVFWLRADTNDNIESDLNTWAGVCAKECLVPQDPHASAMAFCRWLAGKGEFLLVLDNVDDVALATPWVQAVGTRGRVLLTTRKGEIERLASVVPVGTLSKQEGAALLLRYLYNLPPSPRPAGETNEIPLPQSPPAGRGLGGQEEAEALSERLGGLPLALDQAGAVLKERKKSLAWYAQQYEEQGKFWRETRFPGRKLKSEQERYAEHDSVGTTFTIATQALAEDFPLGIELLRYCAFLAPDAIPQTIFTKGAKDIFGNEALWEDTVAAAANLSLLEQNTEAGTITVHRLVQEVTRDGLSEEQIQHYATQTIEAVSVVTGDITQMHWWEPSLLHPHWATCTEWAMNLSTNTSFTSRLLSTQAILYQKRSYYLHAEPLYRKALKISLDIYGEKHPIISTCYNNLAELLSATGKYQEAEPLYRQSLEIDLNIHGEKHPNTGLRYNNLAGLLDATGRYQEAEPHYRKALEINLDIYGEKHPVVATNYNNLAGLLRATGRYQGAEQLYRKALEIDLEIHGEKHPDTARDYNNLSGLLKVTMRYQEAEPLYRKALEIDLNIHGEKHPSTAIRRNNLGGLLYEMRQFQEAEILFRKMVEVLLSFTDFVHPNAKVGCQNWLSCLETMQEKGLFPFPEQEMQEVLPLLTRAKQLITEGGE